MKKLLTLLLASTLMFACSSSDSDDGGDDNKKGTTTQLSKTTTPIDPTTWKGYANDPESPNYVGEGNRYISPIFGDWILTHENGTATNRFLVYLFVYGQGWYSILTKPAEGENPHFTNLLRYQYNDTQLKDGNGIIYTYKTSSDLSTMTLFDGSNTWVFKRYDNNGVWKWNGDWNDKSSPYYAVYNGQYNPVKGEWRLIIDGGFNVIQERYFYFNDKFVIYYKNVDLKEEYYSKGKYQINNIGLYNTQFDFLGYQSHKYWIEGDTLYFQGVSPSGKLQEISKLIKAQ